MELIFGGDLNISTIKTNRYKFSEEFLEFFMNSDFRILNLEGPVTDSNNKIEKTGPHIKSSKELLESLISDLSINAMSLSNNHIMDFGSKGLADTLDFLDSLNISACGAGLEVNQVKTPIILEIDNLKCALLNFSENEWSSSFGNTFGSNGLDVIENLIAIESIKAKVDKVILLIHCGNEHFNLPNPQTRKILRFFANRGADAIICHHSHCVSGYEIYNNVPIFYGLGNFAFSKDMPYAHWRNGLVLKLIITKKKNIKFSYRFLDHNLEQSELNFVNEIQESRFSSYLTKLNRIIVDDKELENEWIQFIRKSSMMYYNYLDPMKHSKSKLIRSIGYRMSCFKLLINDRYLRYLLNIIRCESHRYALIGILENTLKDHSKSNITDARKLSTTDESRK